MGANCIVNHMKKGFRKVAPAIRKDILEVRVEIIRISCIKKRSSLPHSNHAFFFYFSYCWRSLAKSCEHSGNISAPAHVLCQHAGLKRVAKKLKVGEIYFCRFGTRQLLIIHVIMYGRTLSLHLDAKIYAKK